MYQQLLIIITTGNHTNTVLLMNKRMYSLLCIKYDDDLMADI